MFSRFYEKASQQKDSVVGSTSRCPPSTTTNANKKRRRRRRKGKRGESFESIQTKSTSEVKRKSSPTVVQPKQSKRRRRQVPSEEALALSSKLKELSSQKRLDEALTLYWHESNDSIRDGHHACIVVDCSARCGSIVEGEKVVAEMKKSGMHVNVETFTALLKGYAHSGMVRKGAELFKIMCRSNDKGNRPNIRTLNTMLRGCLWTAATADGSIGLSGGIASGEECWKLFRSSVSVGDLDCSSYEYYVAQLCYALRINEAKDVIDELKRQYNITNPEKLNEAEPSAVESLAVTLVALARGMALLHQYDEAAEVITDALHAADTARQLLRQDSRDESPHQELGSTGGKRGWKTNESVAAPQRAVSNSLFRSHRLSEVRAEAEGLRSICYSRPKHASFSELVFHLSTRLLYFGGGGTTESSAQRNDSVALVDNNPSRTRCQLMNSLWHSFGLRTVILQLLPNARWVSDVDVFSEQELLLVQRAIGSTGASVLSDDGFIDFHRVFQSLSIVDASEDSKGRQPQKRPLDIELGSGFGDWIIRQAMHNSARNYVAVELRADRVAQTFSKVFLNGTTYPLSNVCCVGSDCGSFLRKRVRRGTVSTIFVNHPEPPTQTYGSNDLSLADIAECGNEPAHMLTSDTLVSASRCLLPNGKLIIVTDNQWYARLICATLVNAMKRNSGLICSSELDGSPGMRRIETFGDSREHVVLYEGQPSEVIGHPKPDAKRGTSYFDRLWRSGAGTHAERKKRFIVSMERAQVPTAMAESICRSKGKRYELRAEVEDKEPKKERKNRKKSEAKQRRRNERRLARREALTQQSID